MDLSHLEWFRNGVSKSRMMNLLPFFSNIRVSALPIHIQSGGKYLGIILNSHLTFHKHSGSAIQKFYKTKNDIAPLWKIMSSTML